MDVAYFPVANAGAIEKGTCRPFEIAGLRVIVAHLADGFYAVENRCSHAGNPLDPGHIYKGAQIACPRHGARFDLKTGAAKSAPAFRGLAVFPVRLSDGQIAVGLPTQGR